jgi:tripartite-type tricarboxylate transporter receptor subunit TctC
VADLVAFSKANPGKLTFGSGSSSSRVCGELLKMRTGMDATHVPYRSIPPAVTDVIGGQISFTFADPQSGVPQIEAGKVRGLAVSGTFRVALAPNRADHGRGGRARLRHRGLFRGLRAREDARRRPPSVSRLPWRALSRIPATVAKLTAVGIEPSASTPAELRDQVAAEITKWAAIVKSAGDRAAIARLMSLP